MRRRAGTPEVGVGSSSSVHAATTVTAEQVAQYLRHNPDFLLVQPDLVAELAPPARWSGDTIVDFQRFMVEMLRSELAGMRDCAHSVIETSRSNMAVQLQTHAAVLTVIAAGHVEELIRIVNHELPLILGVDAAALALEPAPGVKQAVADIRELPAGDVDRILGAGTNVRLVSAFSDDGALFAEAAPLVRSAALARLTSGRPEAHGLLALGSYREALFHPGQGTELLTFLARIIELCLQRLLSSET